MMQPQSAASLPQPLGRLGPALWGDIGYVTRLQAFAASGGTRAAAAHQAGLGADAFGRELRERFGVTWRSLVFADPHKLVKKSGYRTCIGRNDSNPSGRCGTLLPRSQPYFRCEDCREAENGRRLRSQHVDT